MPQTVVFLHAHPDDETLLTGGTIALLAEQGVNVVVITATDGAAGLASTDAVADQDLSQVRSRELDLATKILGVSEVISLGYADSGLDGQGSSSISGHVVEGAAAPFVQVPLDEVAERVAALVVERDSIFIVGYDPSGGYGHPDHVRISELGRAVAERTGVRLLEASLPREPYAAVANVIANVARYITPLRKVDVSSWEQAYLPKSELFLRVDVREQAKLKRAALKAHASQATGGPRTISMMRAVPIDLYKRLFGVEWFAYPVWADGLWEYQLSHKDRSRTSFIDFVREAQEATR
ncbi:MAG: PIG-L family deacetylase [Candidatus Nanopelagicales bacterium]